MPAGIMESGDATIVPERVERKTEYTASRLSAKTPLLNTPFHMKVALVRSKFNYFGGAEKFVERALDALLKIKVTPSLICQEWIGHSNEISIIKVPKAKGWTRVARAKNFSQAVRHEIKQHHFDLIQTHERIPGFDIFRAGDGVHKTWLTIRNQDSGFLKRMWTALDPFHRYQLKQEKELFEHENLKAVICNSEMVKTEIVENFAIQQDKIHVIYNGIDTDKFRPASVHERGLARQTLGLSPNAPILIFLGSGFERKGLRHLLAAMELASDRLELLVVGGDKHRKSYEEYAGSLGIRNRVHFLGEKKDPIPYLWAADAMTFPTLYDPCPNAVLEGMACGLGIVTSPHCGAKEMIDVASGICVSPYDTQGLANALDQFVNPHVASAMGHAARLASEKFTLDRMGNELLDLYRSLANQK